MLRSRMVASILNIPKHELETLARCFLPDIQALFKSEKGREEYEAWKEDPSHNKDNRETLNRLKTTQGRGEFLLPPLCAKIVFNYHQTANGLI